MVVVLSVLGALAGLAASGWLGYRYGVKCRKLPESRYWIANAVGLLTGMVVSALGAQFAQTWLWVAGLGIMAGSLTGLKYGLGKSVGFWRLVDGTASREKRS
jgi:hypothetical protein